MWEQMKPQNPVQPHDLTETSSCLSSLGNSSRRKDWSQAPEQHWLSCIRPCFFWLFKKKTSNDGDFVTSQTIYFTALPSILRDGCTRVPMLQFDSISFAVSWKTDDLSLLVETLMTFKHYLVCHLSSLFSTKQIVSFIDQVQYSLWTYCTHIFV